jgi:ribosomal-protein-alanine N-acetyltransferase
MNLAVMPGRKKKGVWRAMLTHALAFFREQGATECYLEVREHNENARTLYALFGFKVIGRRKRYYPESGEDALVMRLFL